MAMPTARWTGISTHATVPQSAASHPKLNSEDYENATPCAAPFNQDRQQILFEIDNGFPMEAGIACLSAEEACQFYNRLAEQHVPCRITSKQS